MAIYTDKKTSRLFIQFQYRGVTYKERLPAGTKRGDAKRIETKMRSDVTLGSFGIGRDRNITFEAFIRDVFDPYAESHYTGRGSFDRIVIVLEAALPFFKGMPMRAIKAADVERFKAARENLITIHKRRRAPATVLRELCVISKLFSLAVANDICDYNPCSRVQKPKFDNVQNRILQSKDEAKFFAAFKSQWAEDICRIVVNTGLRANDILGLTKFDVSRDLRMISLIQGKTRQRVEIPMNDTVAAVIDRRWKNATGPLLFASPRTGRVATHVRRAITGACERAHIDRLTIRDLRRTFGTRLHELGFDDSTVAQLLGHADMRSIHRYKRGTAIKKQAVFSLESAKNLPPRRTKKA